MALFTEYKSIFECFSRMTMQENKPFLVALDYCCNNATPALSAKFFQDAKKEARRMLNELKKQYQNEIAKGTDSRQVFNRLKTQIPAYLFDALKKELHINAPQEAKDTLEMYLKNNIALIPSKDKRPLIAYTKEPAKMITDIKTLTNWKQKGVTEYGFIPAVNNIVIIDLDKGNGHANKTDGIKNFIDLVSNAKLNDKLRGYLSNFPANYPCYTQTQSGGLHLYFKASYITPEIAKRFDNTTLNAKNIELKYNTKVTAAGSVYNGKAYTMHGNLTNRPEMTLDLLDLLTKTPQTAPKKSYKHFERTDGKKWNDTPAGIIDKANELYSGYANHDFIYKTAVLFHNAGYDKATAERYILQTPQHIERENQADTQTAINSIYK